MMNLILGDTHTPVPSSGEHIMDSSDEKFMDDVINASMEKPILVDFWAPWCGPCKQLTPILEEQIQKMRGKVKLVKINIDESPMVAGQMGIQSIPAVVGFFGGRPVDVMQGAQQGAQIKSFIERILKMTGSSGDDVDAMLAQAEELLKNEDYANALPLFEQAMQQASEELSALSGFLTCLLKLGEYDRLQEILEALDDDSLKDQRINSVKTMFDLIQNGGGDAGQIDEYRTKIDKNPNDHESRIELAKALVANGNGQEACDILLESIRIDNAWNDGAARQELLHIFEALGNGDKVVMKARRRLSSLIFS